MPVGLAVYRNHAKHKTLQIKMKCLQKARHFLKAVQKNCRTLHQFL